MSQESFHSDPYKDYWEQLDRVEKSPLGQGIKRILDEINKEALEGSGQFAFVVYSQPIG